MKLVWDGTDNEALPDFEYFNKFYDRLPRAKYVTIEDTVKPRKQMKSFFY